MRWHEECWVRWRDASDYAPLIPQSLCLSLGTRGWSRFLQGGLVALCLFKDGRLHQHVPQPEQIVVWSCLIRVAQAWSNMKLLIGTWSAHGLVRLVDRQNCCRKKDEESEENRQNMAKQVNQKQSVDYTVHHAQTHPFDQIPLLIGMGTSIVAEPALKCSERPEWAEGSCLFPKHRRAHLQCDTGCGGNVLWCGLLLGIPRACHFSALQRSHWEARWGKHCWPPDLATVYLRVLFPFSCRQQTGLPHLSLWLRALRFSSRIRSTGLTSCCLAESKYDATPAVVAVCCIVSTSLHVIEDIEVS